MSSNFGMSLSNPQFGKNSNGQLPFTSINETPVIISPITKDVDSVPVHKPIGEINHYFTCPKPSCPACLVAGKPTDTYPIPVYNANKGRGEILRVPINNFPNSLYSQLGAAIGNQDGYTSFKVSRSGFDYTVEPVDLGPEKTKQKDKVTDDVLKRIADGNLNLSQVFPTISEDELREDDHILEQLHELGYKEDAKVSSQAIEVPRPSKPVEVPFKVPPDGGVEVPFPINPKYN